MIEPIPALIFIKEVSERVPSKNFRILGDKPLYQIIIDTLRQCHFISKVLVNTDSTVILDHYKDDDFVILQQRSDYLKSLTHNEANEIIKEMIQGITDKVFFNTHTTNPMLSSSTIDAFISYYFSSSFDSMFMATKLNARFWSSDLNPLNFKLGEIVKTQDLDPMYLENSCGYLFKRELFLSENNRLSGNIGLMEIDELESIDIDTESQFELASKLYSGSK